MVHIQLEPQVLCDLEYLARKTHLEFSGLGFVKRDGEKFIIYDFVPFNIGSEVFTEIDPKDILPLIEREDAANLKAWIHRHPLGNSTPGPHNWSGRDEQTIREEPLGGVPEMVGWSVSVVRTLTGTWVGRVDNHITKQTRHLEVFPQPSKVAQDLLSNHQPKVISSWRQPQLSSFSKPVPSRWLNRYWEDDDEVSDIGNNQLRLWQDEYEDKPVKWFGGQLLDRIRGRK